MRPQGGLFIFCFLRILINHDLFLDFTSILLINRKYIVCASVNLWTRYFLNARVFICRGEQNVDSAYLNLATGVLKNGWKDVKIVQCYPKCTALVHQQYGTINTCIHWQRILQYDYLKSLGIWNCDIINDEGIY